MTRTGLILPRIGWGIAVLVLLRILFSCILGNEWNLFAQPQVAASLLPETETTPALPPTETEEPNSQPMEPEETDPAPTEPAEPPEIPEVTGEIHRFEEADTAFLEINYAAKRTSDLAALLTQPLSWNLTRDEPTVLIFHTHGTEAYTPTEGFTYKEEGGEYRTTEADCNMLSLGQELTRLLKEAGIHAVHDKTLYDAEDYLASYDTARAGVQAMLKKYPTVKLVIDLHRDSAQREDGSQWATEAIVNGEKTAQIMLVLGTDSYYHHPNWEQNLGLALKINALMEKTHPGVTRPLDLRKQRFNQDLSAGALIAEIGAAGNTHREAMNAVSVLAEAIILLSEGTA